MTSLPILFSIANVVAAVGWLALVFVGLSSHAPRRLAIGIAIGLSLAYTGLIGAFMGNAQGGFDSLANVGRLFEHPGLLLAGWVHYLAFDLLLGVWEREQARALGWSRWLLAPLLFLTFMFGPIGWLAFLAVRQIRRAPSTLESSGTSKAPFTRTR